MKIFKYLYWLCYTSRKCDHGIYKSRFIEMGMGKCKYCLKCGKVLEII